MASDFGDILERWEAGAGENAAAENGGGGGAKSANPMDVWLARYGAIDKDREAREHGERTRAEMAAERQRLRRMRPQASCDLHGLTREEAYRRMGAFIDECSRHGVQKALIVHGKGTHSGAAEPVLGDAVRGFIEKDPRLGEYGHPAARHGGEGATWVLFKTRRPQQTGQPE